MDDKELAERVAERDSAAQLTRFTLANTRFTTDGGHFKVTTYRDGMRWSSVADGADGRPISRTVMDGHKTLTVYSPRRGPSAAIIDEPDPMAQVSFDLKRLVREGKLFSLTRTTWNGQAADRFEAHSSYPGIKGPETFDQLIFRGRNLSPSAPHGSLPQQPNVGRRLGLQLREHP